MPLTVRPLSPTLGAEVAGANVLDFDATQFAGLRQALIAHQVVFLRDQPALSPAHQLAFAKWFGPVHVHPSLRARGDLDAERAVLRFYTSEKSRTVAGNRWHTDVSHDAEPPSCSILQLHTVPAAGGDTLFASQYAAYAALSDRMRALLQGLTAHHSGYAGARNRARQGSLQQPAFRHDGIDWTEADHPVVIRHPDSGRPALYVNHEFTECINGLPPHEADWLLHFLTDHAARVDFQYRFQWTPNSIAIWDNRCVQHYAVWDYYPHERRGHRVSVVGGVPQMWRAE